jgi:hypothetical protein
MMPGIVSLLSTVSSSFGDSLLAWRLVAADVLRPFYASVGRPRQRPSRGRKLRLATAHRPISLDVGPPIAAFVGIIIFSRRVAFAKEPGLGIGRRRVRGVLRRSPWKFTVGLPGSSGGAGGVSWLLKLLRLAQASINVPSTAKCSSDSSRLNTSGRSGLDVLTV